MVVSYLPVSGGRRRKGTVVKADNNIVTLVGANGFETTLRADVTCKLMPCEGCDEDCPMRGGVR